MTLTMATSSLASFFSPAERMSSSVSFSMLCRRASRFCALERLCPRCVVERSSDELSESSGDDMLEIVGLLPRCSGTPCLALMVRIARSSEETMGEPEGLCGGSRGLNLGGDFAFSCCDWLMWVPAKIVCYAEANFQLIVLCPLRSIRQRSNPLEKGYNILYFISCYNQTKTKIMGSSSSSSSSVSAPPPSLQSSFGTVVNRLADANPELGAAILAQRRRFQSVIQVSLAASIQKKSLVFVCVRSITAWRKVRDEDAYTCEFKYDATTECHICIMQYVRENSAHKLSLYDALFNISTAQTQACRRSYAH